MTAPLEGIRVLDLGEGIAGAYATKLFADFGAEVVKVEPPGGEALRRQGPFKDGLPGPERSGTFFWFNTNKRGLVLDLASDGAGAVFDRLIDWCDVLIETGPPGRLDALGLGWERIHARQPAVSLISLAPFGQDSPYRDYQLSDLTLYGFAGEMYSIGTQDRAPVKMYGTAALVECGAAAATALLAAVTVSELQGIGQRVDFALADAQFNGVDRRHATTIGWEFAQRLSLRAPGPAAGILAGVYPCADGYVEFSGAALRWDRFVEMLDGAEWATPSGALRARRSDRSWWRSSTPKCCPGCWRAASGKSGKRRGGRRCSARRCSRSMSCSPMSISVSAASGSPRSTPSWARSRYRAVRLRCRPRPGRCGGARRGWANIPTKCWANAVTARRSSPRCARRG